MKIKFDGRVDKEGHDELVGGGLFSEVICSAPCEIRKGLWQNGTAYMIWRSDEGRGRVIYVSAARAPRVESNIAAGVFSDFEQVAVTALISEFKQSHLNINDFVKEKLSELGPDGEARSKRLLDCFVAIDRNYADLQEAKSKGVNRQEWLRSKIDSRIEDLKLGGRRAEVGAMLDVAVSGHGDVVTTGAVVRPFDGIDAVDIVADIDKRIAERACESMTKNAEVEQ